jgi:hypothetical protein
MDRICNQLAAELPQLPQQCVVTLSRHGFRDRKHLEDVVRGNPDGGQLLCNALEIDQRTLLNALGLTRWPEHIGFTLSGPCPLGGVLEPTEEMNGARRPQKVGLPSQRLPSASSLISRYGPARNQGHTGTCTSFGTVAIVEGQISSGIDLSEAFVYSLTKAMDGHSDSQGSWLRFSTRVLSQHGVCCEQTWPYREDHDYLRLRPSDEAFAEASKYQLPEAAIALEPTDTNAVRGHIAARHPVAISVPIYRSTMNSLRFHEQGRFLMKLGLLDTAVGYHAMCAVGYLDNGYLIEHGFAEELGGGAFLVRNSWGPTWAHNNPQAKLLGGEGGYALIPYAYLENYCFEAYTAVVKSSGVGHSSTFRSRVQAAGESWWRRTRKGVVTLARERLSITS